MTAAFTRAHARGPAWFEAIIGGSRETNASVYVAPQSLSPVSYLGAPLALAVSLDKIPRVAGGASLSLPTVQRPGVAIDLHVLG